MSIFRWSTSLRSDDRRRNISKAGMLHYIFRCRSSAVSRQLKQQYSPSLGYEYHLLLWMDKIYYCLGFPLSQTCHQTSARESKAWALSYDTPQFYNPYYWQCGFTQHYISIHNSVGLKMPIHIYGNLTRILGSLVRDWKWHILSTRSYQQSALYRILTHAAESTSCF